MPDPDLPLLAARAELICRAEPTLDWLDCVRHNAIDLATAYARSVRQAVGSEWAVFVLSPGNLPWLMASVIVLKLLHEFGHAFACRHYGGEVHIFGVMILVFSPLPFVDATFSSTRSMRVSPPAVTT